MPSSRSPELHICAASGISTRAIPAHRGGLTRPQFARAQPFPGGTGLARGLRHSPTEENMKPSRYFTIAGLLLVLAGAGCTRTVYVRERAEAPRPRPVPTMVEVQP